MHTALKYLQKLLHVPISGLVDRVSDTETVGSDLNPGRVKLKTIKIGIYSQTRCQDFVGGF